MTKLRFPASAFISPTDPVIRIEAAIDCDGSDCNRMFVDGEGNTLELPPHFHWIESQAGAGERTYADGGALPDDNYEPAHLWGAK